MIIKNGWFNFMMNWHRIQCWLGKKIEIRWRHQSHYWIKRWKEITNLWIGITFILKFNFEKRITCQNVKIVLKIWVSSNGCNEIESWFSSTEGMWMGVVDSSSEIMRIKTCSRTLLSLGNTIGVDINSRIRFELLNWSSCSYSSSSSIQEMDNLPNYQEVDVGQVQVVMIKLKLDFQNDMIRELYEHLVDMKSQSYFALCARSLAQIP